MKITLTVLAIAVSVASGLAAPQGATELRTPSPSAVSRRASELASAERAWREADRNLETDLLRVSRSEILSRLRKAESSMIARGNALYQYNLELVRQARQMLRDLETSTAHHASAGRAMWENRERVLRQISEFEARIAGLEARLAGLPADGSDESAVARDRLEAQIKAAGTLRESLRRQASLSETIGSLADSSDRGPAVAHARSVVESLERELEDGSRESKLWSDYYQSLRERVLDSPGKQKGRKEQ